MNLLSLINPSLANIYCSIILSNYGAIRLKRLVSQFTRELCNWFFLSTFNTSCISKHSIVTFLTKNFWNLNKTVENCKKKWSHQRATGSLVGVCKMEHRWFFFLSSQHPLFRSLLLLSLASISSSSWAQSVPSSPPLIGDAHVVLLFHPPDCHRLVVVAVP